MFEFTFEGKQGVPEEGFVGTVVTHTGCRSAGQIAYWMQNSWGGDGGLGGLLRTSSSWTLRGTSGVCCKDAGLVMSNQSSNVAVMGVGVGVCARKKWAGGASEGGRVTELGVGGDDAPPCELGVNGSVVARELGVVGTTGCVDGWFVW